MNQLEAIDNKIQLASKKKEEICNFLYQSGLMMLKKVHAVTVDLYNEKLDHVNVNVL